MVGEEEIERKKKGGKEEEEEDDNYLRGNLLVSGHLTFPRERFQESK